MEILWSPITEDKPTVKWLYSLVARLMGYFYGLLVGLATLQKVCNRSAKRSIGPYIYIYLGTNLCLCVGLYRIKLYINLILLLLLYFRYICHHIYIYLTLCKNISIILLIKSWIIEAVWDTKPPTKNNSPSLNTITEFAYDVLPESLAVCWKCSDNVISKGNGAFEKQAFFQGVFISQHYLFRVKDELA